MDTPEPELRVRPESIIARNFSADLDSLFGLNSGATIGHLSQNVEQKKRNVSSQEQELQAIEDRLREAEQRLARAASGTSPPSWRNTTTHQASAGANGHGVNRTGPVGDSAPTYQPYSPSDDTAYQAAPSTRPQNYREESFRPHIPGAMPRTPTPGGGAGGDYISVDRSR
ncbi:hypothetical protein MBLNU459_g3453t1 [Dothideomycetes sp. NU459]